MIAEAGDVDEVYVEDAPAEPIAMVAGAWYLVRDFGEAIGPFDAAGEGSEIEKFKAVMGGRIIDLDVTREGIAQLHSYPSRAVNVPAAVMTGLFDTVIRFGYKSLEHNAARKAANNYQIGALHVLAELAKEKAVCVTRRHETWGEEDRAQRAAAAEEERSGSPSAPSASEDDPAPASQPATEETSPLQRGESASRPRSGSSARLPASWHRKAEEKAMEAIPSPECATIPGEQTAPGASIAAARAPAQGSLFLAHEIAATVKPTAVKARRGGKKAARA